MPFGNVDTGTQARAYPHLEQPSDLTSKIPLWLWGWLWDGSSSFQSLGQKPRRCPCRETTVPKHILKTQLSRDEQAAEELSGSSEGGKWGHTLKKPLKNSCCPALQPVRPGCYSAAKICLQWFNVRPWRNSRVALVPTPPLTARFMILYHPASYFFLKLALQAPKSSLVSLKILLGQRNSARGKPLKNRWACTPKVSTHSPVVWSWRKPNSRKGISLSHSRPAQINVLALKVHEKWG